MTGWAVVFFGVGLLFVCVPHWVIQEINQCAQLVQLSDRIPLNAEFFWLALAGSLMMTIAYLSYKGGQDPSNRVVIHAVLISKLASSVFFLGSAVRTGNMLYALGATVDFPIFGIIWIFYRRVCAALSHGR